MKQLRILLSLLIVVINLSFMALALATPAYANPTPPTNTTSTLDTCTKAKLNLAGPPLPAEPYNDKVPFCQCFIFPDQKGILTSHPIAGAVDPMSTFTCYVGIVLTENVPFVMIGATLWIIVSGIMYMLSGGSPGELTKAKQRIVGVLAGVALYFLIRFLVPVVISGISL